MTVGFLLELFKESRWQHAELFLEAFGEVGGGAESDKEAYLCDSVLAFHQQPVGFFQAGDFDEVVGSHSDNAFDFGENGGAAHIRFLCQLMNVLVEGLNKSSPF